MSVAVLLVTHEGIGSGLLHSMRQTLGELPLPTAVLEVSHAQDPDERIASGRAHVEQLNNGDGVLILTDVFGATPSNIANRIGWQDEVRVVAGLNLPMLLKIYNAVQLDLDALAKQAVAAGKRGVLQCPAIHP